MDLAFELWKQQRREKASPTQPSGPGRSECPVFSTLHPSRTPCCPDSACLPQSLEQSGRQSLFQAKGERSNTQLKRKNLKTVYLLLSLQAYTQDWTTYTHTNPQQPHHPGSFQSYFSYFLRPRLSSCICSVSMVSLGKGRSRQPSSPLHADRASSNSAKEWAPCTTV